MNMKPIKTITALLVVACTGLSTGVFAQASKDEVVTAITQTANCVADVMLDEQGKSRCDYNLTEGKWYPYEVPWHTGQAVNALLAAYKQTKNEKYLNSAKKAGDYWIGLQIKDHPKLKGMLGAVHGDFVGENDVVFATISDGSPGIYELTRVSKDKKYAKVATDAAAWMLKNMYVAEKGVCYDNVDLKTGEVQKESSPFWSNKPVEKQTLYDLSRPNTEGWIFKDAYEFSGNVAFKDAFLNLCNKLLELQDKDGIWPQFMPNFQETHSFHPRFNLWYAESLIEAWKMTGDKKYLEAAAKTARTHAKAQQKDGTMYYDNYTDGKAPDKGSVTGSEVSFAGIVWMALSKQGYKEFDKNIEKSAYWIIHNRFAEDHPDKNLRGVVLETRIRSRNNKVWLVNRDIGTSFALRFLTDYYNYKSF